MEPWTQSIGSEWRKVATIEIDDWISIGRKGKKSAQV